MNFLERLGNVFTKMSNTQVLIGAIAFVIAFTLLFYFSFKFLRKNGAKIVIYGYLVLYVVFGAIFVLIDMPILTIVFPLGLVLFLTVLFSTELKRIIWEMSSKRLQNTKHGAKTFSEEEADACINEIIKAVQNMSKNDIGAIIVLSNGNVPDRIIQSGVELNSDITSQLIESIFFPKTALHDGAMIINGTKISAAGCFLPLSQKENLPKEFGTRHRAGIGITETIDVMSIIISEETGIVSTVKAGKIERYVDSEGLKRFLHKFYWQEF